jgi:Cd2+/Zn2+-exporting ATPase
MSAVEEKTIRIPLSIRENGECFNCTNRLMDEIKRLRGIHTVTAAADPCQLQIAYDPNFTSLESIENFIIRHGIRLKQHYDHRHYIIEHLDCPDCAIKLEQRLSKLRGVTWASLNFAASTIWFEYEPEEISLAAILSTIQKAGYEYHEPQVSAVAPSVSTSTFIVSGLDCPDCAEKLQTKLTLCDGIEQADINFTASALTVKHDPALVNRTDIIALVENAGYRATVHGAEVKKDLADFFSIGNARLMLTLFSGLCIGCAAAAALLRDVLPLRLVTAGSLEFTAVHLLYLLAAASGSLYAARSGFYTLRAGTTDMNVLMTVAIIGALAISEFAEAAMVAFLFSLGNLLQSYTLDKTRNALRQLMDLAPREAQRKRGGILQKVPVAELNIDDIIVVKPGGSIPVDGSVIQGESSVNEAPITGESMPADKSCGTRVFAGTINISGALEIKVAKRAEDSTLARIIHLVEEAQSQKAPSQNFVDKFSRIYTPLVMAGSLAVMVFPPLLFSQPFTEWFYRGLMLLVISCPCALVIATPVAIVSAITCASRNGILIKGGAFLEEMAGITAIAFDKTGTLTRSLFKVTDIIPLNGSSKRDVLGAAASLEMLSEHPLAKAIMHRAVLEGVQYRQPADFSAFPGKGIKARLNGSWGFAGNSVFFAAQGLLHDEYAGHLQRLEDEGKTAILIQYGGIQGIVGLADSPRQDAGLCMAELRQQGIEHLAVLSGDNEKVVSALARDLGIAEHSAGMLPEHKIAAVQAMVSRYGSAAMVGDGINDAPALAASTVGIAMGVAGADTALETADIALMSDDLKKLPFLIHLARKTRSIIKANITFAVAVKAIFILLVCAGMANLWLAVAADTGTSLLVILNGMRLISVKRRSSRFRGTEQG